MPSYSRRKSQNGYVRRTVIKRGVISAFDEVSHKKGDPYGIRYGYYRKR